MRGACPSCRFLLPPRIPSALHIAAQELSSSACALWNTGRNSEGKEAAEAEAAGEGLSEGEESAEEENGVAARLAVNFAHQGMNEASQWARNIRG